MVPLSDFVHVCVCDVGLGLLFNGGFRAAGFRVVAYCSTVVAGLKVFTHGFASRKFGISESTESLNSSGGSWSCGLLDVKVFDSKHMELTYLPAGLLAETPAILNLTGTFR